MMPSLGPQWKVSSWGYWTFCEIATGMRILLKLSKTEDLREALQVEVEALPQLFIVKRGSFSKSSSGAVVQLVERRIPTTFGCYPSVAGSIPVSFKFSFFLFILDSPASFMSSIVLCTPTCNGCSTFDPLI